MLHYATVNDKQGTLQNSTSVKLSKDYTYFFFLYVMNGGGKNMIFVNNINRISAKHKCKKC